MIKETREVPRTAPVPQDFVLKPAHVAALAAAAAKGMVLEKHRAYPSGVTPGVASKLVALGYLAKGDSRPIKKSVHETMRRVNTVIHFTRSYTITEAGRSALAEVLAATQGEKHGCG